MQTKGTHRGVSGDRRELAVYLLRQVGWRVDAVSRAAGLGERSVGVYVSRARRALDSRVRAG